MPIPDEIKALKPTCFGAVEIRKFGTSYYVYQISSKYDPVKKRAKKVTGKSMGQIILGEGFVPNANGMRYLQDKGEMPKTIPSVKNFGGYETLQQISPEIEENLKKYFPDIYREINTLALLRLVDGVSNQKNIQSIFLSSYMSDYFKDFSASETTVRKLIFSLGEREEQMFAFMRNDMNSNSTLLFDGTTVFTQSGMSLAQKGYCPEDKHDRQARILCMFERDTQKPVFSRVLPGSIVDKSAFIDTVKLSGCKQCIIIADNGFYTKNTVSFLMNTNISFILPLQSNTKYVDSSLYENPDCNKFDGVFTYHNRTIWYKKKALGNGSNFIYTFRGGEKENNAGLKNIDKLPVKQNVEVLSPDEAMGNIKDGYFSFMSNIDADGKEIYFAFKERWDIEQEFDYLKNSAMDSVSYAQSDEDFKGWAFINHISLLYYYGLLKRLREKKLEKEFSPSDVLALSKNIFVVTYGDMGQKQVSQIQTNAAGLLQTLGVNLDIFC